MAGDGKTSGSGTVSPFGPSTGGAASGGGDRVKNPMQDSTAGGNDFVKNPDGIGAKGTGGDMVKEPFGSGSQKNGVFRNPSSVPSGGATPFVKGGTEPAPSRTDPKSGFAAGGGPGSPKKPFKFTSK